jgi:hypothetical protein
MYNTIFFIFSLYKKHSELKPILVFEFLICKFYTRINQSNLGWQQHVVNVFVAYTYFLIDELVFISDRKLEKILLAHDTKKGDRHNVQIFYNGERKM